MSIQVQGNAGVVAEVETATRALRAILRPPDWGALGSYSMAARSGTMAAGLAGASPVFAFRYTGANLAVVRRVLFQAGNAGTGFAAGIAAFDLFAARTFTASDTGGIAGTLTSPNGKLRTSMGPTGLGDFRIASTATLTAGTRTLDAMQLATLVRAIGTSASIDIVNPQTEFLRSSPGEQPLVIANNEGFVIQATVPATGTWTFGVGVQWDELAAW